MLNSIFNFCYLACIKCSLIVSSQVTSYSPKLLDIFTSANYQEFQRILAEDGYLVKIIPGEGHVKELREAAKDQLFHKEYKERRGAAVFGEHFDVVLQKTVSRTFEVTPEERDIFIGMTPLLFAVDKSRIDWTQIQYITVEGELLIGKKK